MAITFNKESTVRRHLFLKKHDAQVSHASKPVGKTLIVFGIPPYCTREALSHLFSEFGEVEEVIFQQRPSSGAPPPQEPNIFQPVSFPGFKIGYVVFRDSVSADKVMTGKLTKRRPLFTDQIKCISGMKKWNREYKEKHPAKEVLEAQIGKYMEKYDKEEQEREEAEKERLQPDEEGWTTVTRGKKGGGGFKRKTSQDLREEEKKKKKKSDKDIPFFYTSQIRDAKINRIQDLRKKFEDDKKRLAGIKEKRKFKP